MVNLINIGRVISKKYIIPDFQRDYAWTEKNLELMLDDIKEACIQNKKRYILGPIVISGEKVIDGQQRLTSLMIILKALGLTAVDFLGFENREHVEKLFAVLGRSQEQTNNLRNEHQSCEKICTMYQIANDYFASNLHDDNSQYHLKKSDFSDYLYNHVYFLEKELDPDAKIQHSFEVLNTAGEQLKKEDIAKAKIIANMVTMGREKESELFNFAWLLCYDLENDLNDEINKKVKEISDAKTLDNLYQVMKAFVQNEEESAKVSLSKIVNSVENGKIYSRTKSGKITDFQSGAYTVCLTPYDFLDLVLDSSIHKPISDIVKTDSVINTSEQAYDVIKSLLLYRIAFDQYVVRRPKGSSGWFIAKDIKEHMKRLLSLESMLAVSGVEASKTLVSTVKKSLDNALSNGSQIDPEKIITELEDYAIRRSEKELDNLDNGVKTNHFVFHWLDYLLYLNPPCEIKEKAEQFSFIDTSSVEHFMPQHPLTGKPHSAEWEEVLNTFGNLALITPAFNSRQNNLFPEQKSDLAKTERVESLKYEIMLNIAETDGWTVEACKKHERRMKDILCSYKRPMIPKQN